MITLKDVARAAAGPAEVARECALSVPQPRAPVSELRGFAPSVWKMPLWLLFEQGAEYLCKTGDPSRTIRVKDRREGSIIVREIDHEVNRGALARMFPWWDVDNWAAIGIAQGSRWRRLSSGDLEWASLAECSGEIPWR